MRLVYRLQKAWPCVRVPGEQRWICPLGGHSSNLHQLRKTKYSTKLSFLLFREAPVSLLDNVRIVLVEPEFAGNIGATARAMKTMGIKQLILVRPACNPCDSEARRMAHNALDVLESLRAVESLEEALADTHFSVATTQRPRRQDAPFYTPDKAAAILIERAREHNAAIVFGRESYGLTNHEIALCSTLSMVPSATKAPSLNLAQAVMVYAYELYQKTLSPGQADYKWRLASHGEMERFYRRLEQVVERAGARPATTMEAYIDKFRRVFARIPLESRDVNLLYKFLDAVENAEKQSSQ